MKNLALICLLSSAVATVPCVSARDELLAAAGNEEDTLQVGPDSLGPLVLGKKVMLMTRAGLYVEGKVHTVDADTITMQVKKSEPKGSIKGTEATIPTSEIAVVHLTSNGSMIAPVALGVLGGVGGLFIGSYAAYCSDSSVGTTIATVLGTSVGGATGGALLGREAAKKTITINVVQSRHAR